MARTGRVTSQDVARSLGISRATVGFVLNDTPGSRISEETRRRVLAEAERLGYRPHTAAQALARGGSRLVLFVLPDWPIDVQLRRHLAEAEQELDRAGYSMVTYSRHAGARSRPLWEVLEPEVVVGLAPFDAEQLAAFHAAGITRIVPDGAVSAGLSALPSQAEGPRLQIEHLVERGHRVLGFAASADPRLSELSAVRAAAAAARASELGLPEPVACTVEEPDASTGLAHWRARGVTAVAAYNDDVAAAVAGTALRAGLDVPGDLAVVGHDYTPLARLFVPGLTSVQVDVRGLGRYVAAQALASAGHAGGGRALGIPDVGAHVVVRDST